MAKKKDKGPKSLVPSAVEKHPVSIQQVNRSKIPQTKYSDDVMKMTPSWRVTLLQVADPWGWHNLNADELRSVHTRLREYEAKTWSHILINECYRNHRIECHKLCKDARERLSELHLDDLEQLISLRLSSRERVWGILENNVLSLLWWDPEHLVYPVFKHNT